MSSDEDLPSGIYKRNTEEWKRMEIDRFIWEKKSNAKGNGKGSSSINFEEMRRQEIEKRRLEDELVKEGHKQQRARYEEMVREREIEALQERRRQSCVSMYCGGKDVVNFTSREESQPRSANKKTRAPGSSHA